MEMPSSTATEPPGSQEASTPMTIPFPVIFGSGLLLEFPSLRRPACKLVLDPPVHLEDLLVSGCCCCLLDLKWLCLCKCQRAQVLLFVSREQVFSALESVTWLEENKSRFNRQLTQTGLVHLFFFLSSSIHPSIHPSSTTYPGSGRRGSSLSSEAQPPLSPATPSSSSRAIPRRSQARPET